MYKYKGNKDFAIPTSKGIEGSGLCSAAQAQSWQGLVMSQGGRA